MAHSTSHPYTLSSNAGWNSTETLTNNQPAKMDEHARDTRSLDNEGKSSGDTYASGRKDSSVRGAQDNSHSQSKVDTPPIHLDEFKSVFGLTNDKFLVRVNLKGKMVVGDYVISCDILQQFEERYGEGDCLHLAKLYHHERNIEAFVDYMMDISQCHDRPDTLVDPDYRLRFASYWIGWDAHKNERFRKLGPCIGDHVVLNGDAPTKPELDFMIGDNPFSTFNDKMIIERSPEAKSLEENNDFSKRRPNEPGWDGIIEKLLRPTSADDKTFYSLQNLSRLREAVEDPTKRLSLPMTDDYYERTEGSALAVWISMSPDERGEQFRKMWSQRFAKALSRAKDKKFGRSSKPLAGSSITYQQDYNANMLRSRKLDS